MIFHVNARFLNRSLTLGTIIICLDAVVCCAHEDGSGTIGSANVNFIPGDAFFSSSLTERDLASLEPATETLELNYRLPPNLRVFGGQFGYSVLRLEHLPQGFVTTLKRESEWLRKGHPRQFVRLTTKSHSRLSELNPVPVLVYDAKFDVTRFHIGLRYNEDWNRKSHTAKTNLFGLSSEIVEHGVVPYVAFTTGADSVVEDWKNSAHVPALGIAPSNEGFDPFLQHTGDSKGTMAVERPCKLLLLEPVDLQAYFLREERLTFVELTLKGEAKRFMYTGEGKVKPILNRRE